MTRHKMPSLPCPLGDRCTDGVNGKTWESLDVDFDQARKLVEDHVIVAHQAIREQPLSAEDQVTNVCGSTDAPLSVQCPHYNIQITTEATSVVGVLSRSWKYSWFCALFPFCTLCCCFWHLFSIPKFMDVEHKCPYCARILGEGRISIHGSNLRIHIQVPCVHAPSSETIII